MNQIKTKLINAGFHVATTENSLVVSLNRKVYLSEVSAVLADCNVNFQYTNDGQRIIIRF